MVKANSSVRFKLLGREAMSPFGQVLKLTDFEYGIRAVVLIPCKSCVPLDQHEFQFSEIPDGHANPDLSGLC